MTLADQIINLVVEHYLDTEKGLSVKEIAERLSLKPRKVSDTLNLIYGKTDVLSRRKTNQQTFSRDYPMMEHGYVTVNVWEPTKWYLARLLKKHLTYQNR
jgi:hypothetical protein